MDWANVSIFDFAASSAAFSFSFYFNFSAYFYFYYFSSTFILSFDFDFVFDFFKFAAYYYYYSFSFFVEANSNLKPNAYVGFTFDGGNNQIYVLFFNSTSTPFPILLSFMYVPLVLRSVNIIWSPLFYIWQCFELSLLSLMVTSQDGTRPITTNVLSN